MISIKKSITYSFSWTCNNNSRRNQKGNQSFPTLLRTLSATKSPKISKIILMLRMRNIDRTVWSCLTWGSVDVVKCLCCLAKSFLACSCSSISKLFKETISSRTADGIRFLSSWENLTGLMSCNVAARRMAWEERRLARQDLYAANRSNRGSFSWNRCILTQNLLHSFRLDLGLISHKGEKDGGRLLVLLC